MITDWGFYLLAAPAVLLVGISKGGFGGGLGFVAVPMMAMWISPQQAAAILLPILCFMDLLGLRSFRGRWDRSLLAVLIPAALLGVLIGAFSFKYLSDDQIRIMVGVIAVAFSVNFFVKRGAARKKEPNRLIGGFWGCLAGFTSFGVHAGGPPLNVYLLPLKLDKSVFVATTIVFFAAINLIKLVPYTLLGQFTRETLLTSAALMILAPLGVRLGVFLHHRLNERWFYLCCYLMVLLVGSKLIYDGMFV